MKAVGGPNRVIYGQYDGNNVGSYKLEDGTSVIPPKQINMCGLPTSGRIYGGNNRREYLQNGLHAMMHKYHIL